MKPMNFKFDVKLSQISLWMLVPFLLFACKSDVIEEESPQTINADKDESAKTLAQVHSYVKIFDGGTGGYHSYRIPSLIRAKNGALIAFAEGRKINNSDYGDIDVVFKRSTDNGQTWSALGLVVAVGAGTWGTPTSVVDQNTGRVWCFVSQNDEFHNQQGSNGYQRIDSWGERGVYASYSDDHGITWSNIRNLTTQLVPPTYAWDAVGPGNGIQKRFGSNVGRLIIPAIRRNIYSDDGGTTGHYQTIPWGTSESSIVEKVNGTLMRNDLAAGGEWDTYKRRRISTGTFQTGFSAWSSDNELLDPNCQASILRYTDSPNRIMFLNSASTVTRGKMRVRISYDEGATWPVSRRIYDWLTEQQAIDQGKGGYSCMAKTADNMVGALIEINENVGGSTTTSNRSIEFHKFNLSWILNGASEP